MDQFPPQPLIIPLKQFQIFRKFSVIFGAQGAPPMSLIPVVLDLRISPRIFEKIQNGIFWGWGETDSSKKPEAKNLVTLSL